MKYPHFKTDNEREAFTFAVESHNIEGFHANEKQLQAMLDYHRGHITKDEYVRMEKRGDFDE